MFYKYGRGNLPVYLLNWNEHLECLFVEVVSQTRKHKRKILVSVVHRPPNTSISAFTEQIINIVRTLKI